jgi:cellulose synthase/poly-beta-1,6-N-acetylglucosamine synthase-like glycosyltransferase
MRRDFSKKIASCIEYEIQRSKFARSMRDYQLEFAHLERAHVLGQESTFWHAKVHCLMLVWALRNLSVREIFGQIIRVIGAVIVTPIGLVPLGNTGGANVSPFKKMPIDPELNSLINKAKSNS